MSQTKAQLIDNLVQALNFTGTASAPANGLFLSATNTLQLSTASTPRLTINSDGHVDVVGNLDVGAGLDVTGSVNATTTITLASITNGQCFIVTKGGTESAKLGHIGSGNEGFLALKDGGTDTVLLNGETGGISYITSGDVGIGTATPDGKLNVFTASAGTVTANADGDELVLENSGNVGLSLLTAGTGESTIFFGNPGTNGEKDAFIKHYHETHATTANRRNLVFQVSGGERMRLSSSELRLVRTTTNAKITLSRNEDVDADNTPTGVIDFANNTAHTVNSRIQAVTDGTNNVGGQLIIETRDPTSQTLAEKFRIKGDGKVGIGTTPSTNLHVKNGSGDCLVKVESESGYDARLQLDTSNGGGAAAHLDFQMDGTTKGGIEYINNASSALVNCMIFRTTDLSERVRIDADGNVTAAHSIVSANLPGRNLLINGAMQVNQRVGSPNLGYFNPVTSSIYTLDRWKVVIGSGFDTDSAHITKSTQSPAGFGASMKWDIGNTETPSANQNCGIEQKIEGQNLQGLAYGTSSAKTMTLSFHVYSNKTGTYCVQIMQEDGTKYQMHEYTISSSNTWEKKTITIVGNTSNAINNDNTTGLRILWMLTVGSGDHVAASSTWVSGGDLAATSNQVNLWDNGANYWYLTGCQLEIGNIATEFEHIAFGKELLSCQRYFFNVKGDNNHRTGIPGYANSTSSLRAMINFPTAMRGTPTFNGSATAMVFDAADDSASFNCNTLSSAGSLTNTDPHMMMIETSTSGMTSGEAGTLEFRAANGFLEFSSEL